MTPATRKELSLMLCGFLMALPFIALAVACGYWITQSLILALGIVSQ